MTLPEGLARRALILGGLVVLTSSCTYGVVVRPAPSYDALAFEAALPAYAALFVDADQLRREVALFEESLCGSSRYPIDARDALEASVLGTLERLVERVETTSTPLGRDAMEARGADAVIVVRADTFNVGLTERDGLVDFEAGAEITLSVSAFTGDGLQLREIVFGSGVDTDDSGVGCGAGADALGRAVERAIGNAMTELGELIANSPDLRASLGGASGG